MTDQQSHDWNVLVAKFFTVARTFFMPIGAWLMLGNEIIWLAYIGFVFWLLYGLSAFYIPRPIKIVTSDYASKDERETQLSLKAHSFASHFTIVTYGMGLLYICASKLLTFPLPLPTEFMGYLFTLISFAQIHSGLPLLYAAWTLKPLGTDKHLKTTSATS